MSRIEDLEKLFIANQGFLRTSQMNEIGVDSRMIADLLKNGTLIKLRTGLYKLTDYAAGDYESVIEAVKYIPKGVICLSSAAEIHQLTTYIPRKICVAIEMHDKLPLIPEYPPIEIYYFEKKRFETGIETMQINGAEIPVYDAEKTICDFIRYRNKLGIDIMQEVIKEYMKRNDRNIQKLVEYSEKLRVKTILKPYIEALI